MELKRLKQILEETSALCKGHFKLSSGLHSDTYLQCARITQYPDFTAEIGVAIAEKFKPYRADVVVGPAVGGIILAYETGRALKVRSLFAERVDGIMQLRRGFSISPGQKILVIEDVITTGGSVKEVIEMVQNLDGIVTGVGSIIDRSGATVKFDCLFKSLLTLEVDIYQPENCPLCRQQIPLLKPGSRK